jgi:hypothetical protein
MHYLPSLQQVIGEISILLDPSSDIPMFVYVMACFVNLCGLLKRKCRPDI